MVIARIHHDAVIAELLQHDDRHEQDDQHAEGVGQ